MAGLLFACVGILVSLIALVIALWQIRSAKKVHKLEADIIALEAFLTVELNGRRKKEIIQRLLEVIFAKSERLGSKEISEIKKILNETCPGKETLQ